MNLYSERLLDHFRQPRNVGALDPPAITVEVDNPACGDVLRLSASVAGGVVVAAAYQARGCTASIACGSALTEWLVGKTVSVRLSLETAEALVDGLPTASRHAAVLCADALRALQKAYGLTNS